METTITNGEILKTTWKVLTSLGGVWFTLGGILLALTVVFFVLKGIGLNKMAKELDIKNPGFAYVPILADYTLGKVAGCYRKNNGKKSAPLAVILLVLRIAKTVGILIFSLLFAVMAVTVGSYALDAVHQDTAIASEAFALVIPTLVVYLISLAVSLCHTAFLYICYWRTFSLYNHHSATVYTLLSVICRFLAGLFVFLLKDKKPLLSFDDRLGIDTKGTDAE